MSFKQYVIKKIIPTYFMIVTFITAGMGIFGTIFYQNASFHYYLFLTPLLFGAVGCLPLLMDFFFYRSPGKMLSRSAFLRQAAEELVVLELCIVSGVGLLFGYRSAWEAVIPAAMVLAIFAAVTALTYRQDARLCSEMNKALELMRNS